MLRIAWFILDTSSFSEEVLVPLCTCFACYLWWYRVFPVSVYVSPIEVLLFRTLFRWVIGSRSMWLNWQSHFHDESDYWWVTSWYYVPFLLTFSGWLSWSVPADICNNVFWFKWITKADFFLLKKNIQESHSMCVRSLDIFFTKHLFLNNIILPRLASKHLIILLKV